MAVVKPPSTARRLSFRDREVLLMTISLGSIELLDDLNRLLRRCWWPMVQNPRTGL
jgi:hypothetical protein